MRAMWTVNGTWIQNMHYHFHSLQHVKYLYVGCSSKCEYIHDMTSYCVRSADWVPNGLRLIFTTFLKLRLKRTAFAVALFQKQSFLFIVFMVLDSLSFGNANICWANIYIYRKDLMNFCDYGRTKTYITISNSTEVYSMHGICIWHRSQMMITTIAQSFQIPKIWTLNSMYHVEWRSGKETFWEPLSVEACGGWWNAF